MKKRFLVDKTVEEKLMYKNKIKVEVNGWNYKITIPVYEEDKQAVHGYVKCHSCNQYFPGSHPEHGYRMCEDCVG